MCLLLFIKDYGTISDLIKAHVILSTPSLNENQLIPAGAKHADEHDTSFTNT